MGLNKYFSERHGYKPSKVEIQLDSIDNDLRVALWNAMCQTFWVDEERGNNVYKDRDLFPVLQALWQYYFKFPINDFYPDWSTWETRLEKYIFSCDWHEVYEIIEFIMDHWRDGYKKKGFIPIFNNALERELSGYRLIKNNITPITDKLEIAEIEQAIDISSQPIRLQLEDALQKLSDRDNPDYRGSIKDSISAVETLCRLITDEPKLELGKALKVLEESGKVKIHGALRTGFSNIYGWTSDDQGIRHGLMDEPNLKFEDAKYMLVSCSAFINYLISKSAQAGLEF